MSRPPNPTFRPVRPHAPRCRGGASSLLRLAHPAPGRLPSGAALDSWVRRAALALEPAAPMVAPPADVPSRLFTRLWPSAAANAQALALAERA